MGNCGYYKRFIFMYASIAMPLHALLLVFEWIEECEKSFTKLKQTLIPTLILKAPNYSKIFHVHIDALAYIVGCILAQLGGDKTMDFSISYAN